MVITLGAQGIVAKIAEHVHHIEAHSVEAIDTVGAGDCFCGYFAAQLAQGKTSLEAIKIANLAASVSVSRPGAAASIPALDELDLRVLQN